MSDYVKHLSQERMAKDESLKNIKVDGKKISIRKDKSY